MVKKLSMAWPTAVVCSAAVTQEYLCLVQICRTPSAGLEKPAALLVPNFVVGGSLGGWLTSEELILSFFLSRVERGAQV